MDRVTKMFPCGGTSLLTVVTVPKLSPLQNMLESFTATAAHDPTNLLEDPSASRHNTLAGLPLHPDCPRPVRDIEPGAVIYAEYFGENTSEIDHLLEEASYEVQAGTKIGQGEKALKPIKGAAAYAECTDNLDQWMVNTGRYSQQESLEHRAYTRGIRELAKDYIWANVLDYDHAFRALKHINAITSWSAHRPELVCKHLLPGLKAARSAPQRGDAPNKKRRGGGGGGAGGADRKGGNENHKDRKARPQRERPRAPCRRFNSEEGCPMTPGQGPGECWFTHTCSVKGCGAKSHGAAGHKKK